MIVAGVQGQPGLVVSGFDDGALILYRRGNGEMPPQALASFAADLDGSLWDAGGQFLGRLHGDEALFHPDWLERIGASVQVGAAQGLGIASALLWEQNRGELCRQPGPAPGTLELRDPEINQPAQLTQADKESAPSSRIAVGTGGKTHEECVEECLHLLPSPSGDLQSSEFRKCYRECMGRVN